MFVTAVRRCVSRISHKRDMRNQLVVRSLAWETGKPELYNYFQRFGAVERVRIVYNYDTGFSKGFAFVTFQDDNSAKAVLSEEIHTIDGRQVNVNRVSEQAEAIVSNERRSSEATQSAAF